MATKNGNTPDETKIGEGVYVSKVGADLMFRVPMTAQSRQNAPISKTGKSRLLGNTGGFTAIPGTDLKCNLVVNFLPN